MALPLKSKSERAVSNFDMKPEKISSLAKSRAPGTKLKFASTGRWVMLFSCWQELKNDAVSPLGVHMGTRSMGSTVHHYVAAGFGYPVMYS